MKVPFLCRRRGRPVCSCLWASASVLVDGDAVTVPSWALTGLSCLLLSSLLTGHLQGVLGAG